MEVMMVMTDKLKGLGVQVALTFLCTAVAFIPLEIYIVCRFAFNPEGFWQNLFLFGLAFYFLAGAQFILLVVLVFVLYGIWTNFE